MEQRDQQILQTNHVYLQNNISYNEVCDHLIQCEILSPRKHEEIDSLPGGNFAKVRELLIYLPRCGPYAFNKFVNVFYEMEPPRVDIAQKLHPGPRPTTENTIVLPSSARAGSGEPDSRRTRGQGHQHDADLNVRGHSGGHSMYPIEESVKTAAPASQPAPSNSRASDSLLQQLSAEQLNKPCTDKLFAKLSKQLYDAKLLAVWLKIPDAKFKHIQHDNMHSLQAQILELLMTWKRASHEPTVHWLLKALEDADFSSDYEIVIRDFCNGKYS